MSVVSPENYVGPKNLDFQNFANTHIHTHFLCKPLVIEEVIEHECTPQSAHNTPSNVHSDSCVSSAGCTFILKVDMKKKNLLHQKHEKYAMSTGVTDEVNGQSWGVC